MAVEMEALKRRNEELEREVREGREREESTRRELERTRALLHAVEEAEERLCSELAELEAEAVAQSRAYHLRLAALSEQLAAAHSVLSAAGST
ncbi:hypothetical protein OPV22_010235 [Ensete ventricosum]|uniref:Uncharacterized protein n=1 Tax=Ensete ventricosum TaxID=4639 RepID=A0A427AMD5_ENSVE|nr:hypothetical protein OPV22_010235 [Ensete ventricosum]RRT77423.1 hypothetical protein B296_00028634 [Ensete ventricosum]RWW11839.1 hypothetical protein GW17_00024525 [Ensete ventricosum]RWW72966.1 hypothetical protein BHE74_00019185 [Ensete ventricosum]RZS06702.1 hypothetical protein BHM03_00037406 [Ensete ventricosum]